MTMDAKSWLSEAHAKRKDAEAALQCKRFSAACFWSQQAAELGLKAVFLLQKNETPPRVHDLIMLANQVHAPAAIKEASMVLNPAYTSARYIDVTTKPPSKYYKKKDAELALDKSKEVLEWCKSQFR